MPQPRKSQIAVEATPYYHCVSRCVRRAFLCGKDKFTGRSFEHRRTLIESELLRLGQVLFLDLVAYSVMSNHFHVVLFIDQETQKQATTLDIVTRWHQIHKGNIVSNKFINKEPLDPHEVEQLNLFTLVLHKISSPGAYRAVYKALHGVFTGLSLVILSEIQEKRVQRL